MPFRIQRVPNGLNNLLNIFGGGTPIDLEDRIQGSLELLQFYGLTQLQKAAANAPAAVEGGTASLVPSTGSWCVLYAASATIVKTGTMTAARMAVALIRSGGLLQIFAAEECGPFGATETGPATVAFVPPYPLLLPPGSTVAAVLQILGTDANASITVGAEFGLLG